MIYIIYTYIYIYVEFLASHFTELSRFTGWAIIKGMSIRRWPCIFLISWGQITTHIDGKNHWIKVDLTINMYAFMKYDVGLWLWRVFLPDTPETTFGDETLRNLLAWRHLWNGSRHGSSKGYGISQTCSQFTAHDMALVMSISRGSTCMKLVRMWNRRVSRNDVGVYQFTTIKITRKPAWGTN